MRAQPEARSLKEKAGTNDVVIPIAPTDLASPDGLSVRVEITEAGRRAMAAEVLLTAR
jgi:hypothetical protein